MAKQQAAGRKATKAKASNKLKKSPADNVANMLSYMAKMHNVGITEVDETELLVATGYKRHDSKGFRDASKTAIKELGYVSRSGKKYSLTQAGLAKLVRSGEIEKQPKTNKEVQDMYKNRLGAMVKAPSDKLDAIWNLLIDGGAHTQDELLAVSEYKRPDSKGYREIMKWFKKLALLEQPGRGSYQFSKEKLFPFDN